MQCKGQIFLYTVRNDRVVHIGRNVTYTLSHHKTTHAGLNSPVSLIAGDFSIHILIGLVNLLHLERFGKVLLELPVQLHCLLLCLLLLNLHPLLGRCLLFTVPLFPFGPPLFQASVMLFLHLSSPAIVLTLDFFDLIVVGIQSLGAQIL